MEDQEDKRTDFQAEEPISGDAPTADSNEAVLDELLDNDSSADEPSDLNAVAEEEPKNEDAPAEEPAAEDAPVDTAPAEDAAATPTVEEAVPITTPAPKKKGAKGILILIFILLLLGGAITAAILLMPQLTKQQNSAKKGGETAQEIKSEYRIADNSISDFDLQFLKLNNNGENKVYSPLSIKYVLQMLSDASDGETKQQIDAVLGDYKAKSYIDSKNRSLVNAFFVRNNFKTNILDSYISGLKTNYNADVIFDDFTNANNINKWISDKTLNIIKNAVDDSAIENLDFALVNALAIDMQWTDRIQASCSGISNDPRNKYYHVSFKHEKYYDHVSLLCEGWEPKFDFNNQKNIEGGQIGATFNNYDIVKEVGEEKIRSTVKTEYEKWLKTDDGKRAEEPNADKYVDGYMKEIAENYGKSDYSTTMSIVDNDDVKVFAKDLDKYDGATLQYVGIMPKTQDLNEYIKNLKAEDVSNLVSSLKTMKNENFKDGVVTKIKGYIPFFNYKYDLKLVDNLTELGITDVFDSSKADLSKMTSAENESITYAKHQANIEFTNDGIKAAAVTVGGGEGDADGGFVYNWDVPVEEIDMTFDKPFVYIIRDKDSGEIWFTGSVYEIK